VRADGRLRQMQTRGGARKAAFLSHGDEGTEQDGIEHGIQ